MEELLINHKIHREYSGLIVDYDLVVVQVFTESRSSYYLYDEYKK